VNDYYDVLVIGGGGAALRAALAACEAHPGVRVALVTKGELGASGVTATACSDRMAFHATLPHTEPGGADNWRYHADDIYRIGGYVSDGDLAVVLARESASALRYLEELGVPWVRRNDGTIDQFMTDGSRYARACYTGPYTANHIHQALHAKLLQAPIEVIEHTMACDLLQDVKTGAVRGAVLVDELAQTSRYVFSRSVILATGGAGQLFATNVYPQDCTGDGLALAFRAGAELVNLEFIQLGLCSLQTNLACSGSMMRSLPRLVNDRGEEFLRRYMPRVSDALIYQTLFAKGASWPVSVDNPSHIIDIAVSRERSLGRHVYLDYSRNPDGLLRSFDDSGWRKTFTEMKGAEETSWCADSTPLERLRTINQPIITWLRERKVDLDAGDLLEIAPAAQHFQGGIKINARAETRIPGLFAAGEAAGGQHGANRPGGNALLDCQVFGRIAGEQAARYSLQQRGGFGIPNAREGALRDGGLRPEAARSVIQQLMDNACGVYRTHQQLEAAQVELARIRNQGVDASGSLTNAIETEHLLTIAELVVAAALERDESRGPHLRFMEGSLVPLPVCDPAWRQYIVLRLERGVITLRRQHPSQLTLPPEHDSITG